MRKAIVSAGVVLLSGCGGSEESAPPLPEGWQIPPPGEGQVQILADEVTVEPGADVTLCHYIDYAITADQDITDYAGFQSHGGHHVILYAVANEQEAGTHECTETDMLIARYLAGGGAEAGRPEIPEGIALRVHEGSQLMIQTHWINATSETIRGQAGLNVTMGPASADNVEADLLTVVSTQIAIPPASAGSAAAECVMQQDMSFFALGGHEHWRGTHVSITHTPVGGQPTQIYDHDWTPHYEADPPRLAYTKEDPFVVKTGDRFTLDCDYFNETQDQLGFPTEMCVFWAFYYPATREINCVDGVWPTE